MPHSAIGPIAIHLPEKVETIDELATQFPRWDIKQIREKTGVRARHIARPDECASDLGVAAAEKLFAQQQLDRQSVDFLLFCTQTPDYLLPTTACLMQERLGLPRSAGALDFNLGCSGYVYGLALADGLIQSSAARRVLLITAETYSKYIDPTDRSLRTIFGDGAAATLVTTSDEPSLGNFVFGTDGRGGNYLMTVGGGARPVEQGIQPSKRRRWPSTLFMDGPELVKFSLDVLPPLIGQLLKKAEWTRDDVDIYLLHQATTFMVKHIRDRINLSEEKTPEALEACGNTVSSTIPILIDDLRRCGRLKPGKQTLLLGFGVGLSWAGCTWTETWSAKQVQAEEGTASKTDPPKRTTTPTESGRPPKAAP
ncbi:MAG: ketoacyl-ACP synthase III [Pirellulales bacterium]|nr:ketoacyl-ACP synthase III [Pirellulales bacterium]